MAKQSLHYFRLLRFHKPWPILLLLWPTWWALWIAGHGHPHIKNLIIFTLGVIVMRAAGCVINDIADRKFDKQVTRTKERPIAAGFVSVKEALVIFAVLILIAFILVLQLNKLAILMAVPALALAIIYPFMKRYTYFPQVVLGLGWYLGILMAFAAQLNTVPWLAWYVYLTAIVWAIMYDIFCSLADYEDDLKIGVKSPAIFFGSYTLKVMLLLQIVVLGLLIGLGLILHLSYFYYLSLCVVAGQFIYQQALARKGTPQAYMQAFFNNHWVGLWVFLGLLFTLN